MRTIDEKWRNATKSLSIKCTVFSRLFIFESLNLACMGALSRRLLAREYERFNISQKKKRFYTEFSERSQIFFLLKYILSLKTSLQHWSVAIFLFRK